MLLKTINFVKISNHGFKQIRCYNGGMQDKIHSYRFSHIDAYVGIFQHILTYSEIIRHIQELSRDIQAHSEASVTLVYSETWHIQNQSHIQSTGTSRTSSIFTTLSSICNGAYYENNANSFLQYFQMWQTVTLVRVVIVKLNQCSKHCDRFHKKSVFFSRKAACPQKQLIWMALD